MIEALIKAFNNKELHVRDRNGNIHIINNKRKLEKYIDLEELNFIKTKLLEKIDE